MENLHSFRKNYTKNQLNEADIHSKPLQQFKVWFQEAVNDASFEANAMVLSTVGKEGMPSSRVVLLKEIIDEGFIFYTNYKSKKAKDLAYNNKASILFFWEKFERQIRIEGEIEKISEQKSINYFNSRPKASQIGAVISMQSEEVSSRKILEEKFEKYNENQEIEKPKDWGGYILKANKYEFWQGRASRIHDRIVYQQEKNSWNIKRLNP
ncbi:MAG: pyridoxamine 5'-phosphate oxidase [Chitinophagales bacterium]